MPCKQDLISSAMVERIAQLEAELRQCKLQLCEAIGKKEKLECDIEALQAEAHDVVAQWVDKTSELQKKHEDSVLQVTTSRTDLLLSEKKNNELQEALKKAEATNCAQAEELQSLKENYEASTSKLETANTDLSSLSQRLADCENLVQERNLQVTQNLEDLKQISKEKSMLIDAVAKLREEKMSIEAVYHESKTLITFLEEEVSSYQKALKVSSLTAVLAEEESCARQEAVLTFLASCFDIWGTFMRNCMFCNSLVESTCRKLQNDVSDLRDEKLLLHNKLEATCTELMSVQEEYNRAKEDFCKQTRILEQDVADLQDSKINQKRILKSFEEKLESLSSEHNLLKIIKEDLAAEFRTVKESYSTLLAEHNNFKTRSQNKHEELNATIAFLKEECGTVKKEFEARLQDILNQNTELCHFADFAKLRELESEEEKERLALEMLWQKEWAGLLFFNNNVFLNLLVFLYKQCLNIKDELKARGTCLETKDCEMRNLYATLDALENKVVLKEKEIALLQSNLSEVSLNLTASKKACEDAVSDNVWLKEQVETMRRELGELDELLNFNLNDMREETERQNMAREKLLQEVCRYEDAVRQSEDKINLLDERCATLAAENLKFSKTVTLMEEELLSTKKEMANISQREMVLIKEKKELESKLVQLEKDHVCVDSQAATLQELLESQEAKLQLLSSSARQEVDAIKVKMNGFIEKYEEASEQVSHLSKRLQESKTAYGDLQGAYQKAKAALGEAKQRCQNDAEAIQKLLSERKSLEQKLGDVMEKYNRTYDMLKAAKKENLAKTLDEMHMLSELCTQQEVELQELRRQNILLKRGIMVLPENVLGDNQAERPIFVERLNLSEGPLRRPKKRSFVELDVERPE